MNYTYGNLGYNGLGNIRVGNFCSLSQNVRVVTHGHNTGWVSTYPFGADEFKPYWQTDTPGHPKQWDITIGHDVWIGQDALIMASIGNGAIIGAGSVVRDEVPPYAIVIGNPAGVVKMRFNANQIAALEQIAWWDWPEDKIKKYIPLLNGGDINEFIREVNSEKA